MKNEQSVTYIIRTIGMYGYYATGDSLLAAAQKILKVGAKRRDIIAVVIVLGDPEAFIDSSGGLNYGGSKAPKAWYLPPMVTGTLGSLLNAHSEVRS